MKTLRMLSISLFLIVFISISDRGIPAAAEQPIPSCQLDAHVIGRVAAVRNPVISPFTVINQDDYIVVGTYNQTSQLDGGAEAIDPLEYAYNLSLFSISLLEPEQLTHLITLDKRSSGEYGAGYTTSGNGSWPLAQNGNRMIWQTPPHLTLISMENGVPVSVEDQHLLPREQAADADGDGQIDMRVSEVSPDGAYILWTDWFEADQPTQLHLYDVAQEVSIAVAPIWWPEDQVGFTQDGQFIFYPQASEAGDGFYGRGVEPDAKPFLLAAKLAWVDVTPLAQNRILFVAVEDGQERLYLADLATQTRTLLYSYATHSKYGNHPISVSVSANREMAVIYEIQEGEVTVYLISLNDGQIHPLALPYDLEDETHEFAFSPDNHYIVHKNTGRVSPISENPTVLMSAKYLNERNFSPDSQYILYDVYDGIDAVYQFSLANQEVVEVISGSDEAPSTNFSGFSHDGAYAFIEDGYGMSDAPHLPVSLYRWTVGSQDQLCEIANGVGVRLLGIGDDTLIYSMWEDGIATLYSVPISME